jgi:hypothetical protein
MWGVYGDEGNFEISGAWLWRGVEIPLEFVTAFSVITLPSERAPII